MKTKAGMYAVLAVLLLGCVGMAAAQSKDVPKSLVRFANESLIKLGTDAQLVAFVQQDNLKPVPVDKLKDLDAKWQNKQIEDFIKTLMANSVSARLAKVIAAYKFIPEAFIMNAQGTIIGETNRTSTYWKGQAEKFTAAYKGGAGAVWFGPLAYDESTKVNGVQISVPVMTSTKAIGAICFTINVDEWEKR